MYAWTWGGGAERCGQGMLSCVCVCVCVCGGGGELEHVCAWGGDAECRSGQGMLRCGGGCVDKVMFMG